MVLSLLLFACLFVYIIRLIMLRIFPSKILNFINSFRADIGIPLELQAHHSLCSYSLLLGLYIFMLLVWKTCPLLKRINAFDRSESIISLNQHKTHPFCQSDSTCPFPFLAFNATEKPMIEVRRGQGRRHADAFWVKFHCYCFLQGSPSSTRLTWPRE